MTIWQVFAIDVFLGINIIVWSAGAIEIYKWLISVLGDATVTRCPTCGHSAETATGKNTSSAPQE